MLQILGITAPIFLIIGIGFIATRLLWISQEQVAGMGRFVISFALPALVFKALVERPLDEVFERNYILAYALASLLIFALGFVISRRLRGDSLSGSALAAVGMSMSNSGFIGYPIAALVVGEAAAIGLAMGVLVENLLMLPLALALAEWGEHQGLGIRATLMKTGKRLLGNPIIIALCLGLATALCGLQVPAIPMRVVEMLAQSSAPVALFVIGGSLVGMRAGGMVTDVMQISIGKLILHPLAVMLCFVFLPVDDPALRVAGVLFACAPMMSIYPIVGQRFGLQGRCAAALVGATVLSFLTYSLFIGWLAGPHL
ncbi:AEC family transporter [Pseudomonas sp. EL_65y_Pfl2_R95]|uniref:AEC family transporter n=1 Tax=Pseudomonas sp. EL_65y_Pfl2_R95 TaxID=3088698 RepID=UPI0030D99FDE